MQKHAKIWSYDGVITVISRQLYYFRVLFLDYFAYIINLHHQLPYTFYVGWKA